MILDLLEEGSTLPITLVYGQRTRAELYYDEFVALAESTPTSPMFRRCRTSRQTIDWTGFRGYVPEAAKAHFDTTSATTRPTCAAPR